MEVVTEQKPPQSFRLYSGKAPLPLQLLAGLMWLAGFALIIQGIPLLLLLGAGLIPICLGTLTIRYARAIFKMQRKGYIGGLVLLALSLAAYIVAFITSKVTSTSIAELAGATCYVFVGMSILYIYRSQFT
jgi:hypothetical protein